MTDAYRIPVVAQPAACWPIDLVFIFKTRYRFRKRSTRLSWYS
jgi:hypothetical protein